MDGNGRWAVRQGRSRSAGHREGAAMVRRIVEAAPDAGIGVLTLYAFSRRQLAPAAGRKSAGSCDCSASTCGSRPPRCVANGVRLEVIGRRDRHQPRAAAGGGGRAARDRGRHPAPPAHRARLLVARRHPPRGPMPPSRDGALARVVRPPARDRGSRAAGPRGGPAHPHRRRAPAERLPPVGGGLRGAAFHAAHVAGVRSRGVGRRGAGIRARASAGSAACPTRRPAES